MTLDTLVDKDASRTSTGPLTDAADTLGGANSADVYSGLGKPGSGMSSKELHHDGQPGRKREGQGVAQWGPPGVREQEAQR